MWQHPALLMCALAILSSLLDRFFFFQNDKGGAGELHQVYS